MLWKLQTKFKKNSLNSFDIIVLSKGIYVFRSLDMYNFKTELILIQKVIKLRTQAFSETFLYCQLVSHLDMYVEPWYAKNNKNQTLWNRYECKRLLLDRDVVVYNPSSSVES